MYYHMDINDLLRIIVVMIAFFINHIYVDSFLIVSERDSIMLNFITFGLFGYKTLTNPGTIAINL